MDERIRCLAVVAPARTDSPGLGPDVGRMGDEVQRMRGAATMTRVDLVRRHTAMLEADRLLAEAAEHQRVAFGGAS